MLLQVATLIRWLTLPPEAMLTSGPMLLPRAVSGSVALLQLGSVSMYMVRAFTKSHADVHVLYCCLKPLLTCSAEAEV